MTGRDGAFDLLVVGGGINGAGIARDAAGRGLNVLLCEQHDLASHTSSSSTKLIHGGLRYLEYYDFGLVRKSLREREIVIRSAPHIVWPLRFVLPHDRNLRPAWMMRAGLFLYDHLAKRRLLPGSHTVDLRRHPAGAPLERHYRRGYVYSDAWVDDARLVVLTAVDAHEHGATVMTRTRCKSLRRENGAWTAILERGLEQSVVRARAVVNATGPWVARFLDEASPVRAGHHPRMIKGSHIVVPRMFEHDYAYIFQHEDRRIVFAIPFEQDYTLLGTTDVEYRGDPARVAIDPEEVAYLCALANHYFARPLAATDVVWSYAGVRPLLDDRSQDPASITRDYRFELDAHGPPLLSIIGGKITTYRRLAEEALALLLPRLASGARPWTAGANLPGGDMPGASFADFDARLARDLPALEPTLRHRYARAYGTRIAKLLRGATHVGQLGEAVLPGLYRAEIDYLRREEWARTADDILWRRSRLGLHLPPQAVSTLATWLAANPA
jgi:glycerol-3-phosphate dehydrogenase